MVTGWLDLETITFLVLCPVFVALEWLWPARPIKRWRQLPIDLLAFFILLPAGKLISIGLHAGVAATRLDEAASALEFLRRLPPVPKVALGIVLVDLSLYWMHRAFHSDALWRIHQWHHSIEHLYWFSGFRASFMQLALNAIPQFVIPFTIFHATPLQIGVGFSIGLVFQFWIHANLAVSLGPLRHILVSPDFHRVHHSLDPEHRDKNFAGFFSIWDRLFGTFVDPTRTKSDFPIGLNQKEPATRMLAGL
jgi:sterol desaturase/sphingolipid hydroxylase (fatty acid hydroxylase superfamily)